MFNNKSVCKQVSILNETLVNIISIFIPTKLPTFDDSDSLWMKKFVKSKINWKS